MPRQFEINHRSWIMKKIKATGNKSTELIVVKIFRRNRITGWRRHWKITGKPDFVFPKARVAIFVDGCYWHGHTCREFRHEKNAEYWLKKIERNRLRDKRVNRILKVQGWSVVRVWECKLGEPNRFLSRVSRLLEAE